MNSNETLLSPEPVVDLATALPQEDTIYTFERADGTIERAMSADDAIARCPVLGKLAIEAPDQANLLLKLAALGKEKIQAEQLREESTSQEKPKAEPNSELKTDTFVQEARSLKAEPRLMRHTTQGRQTEQAKLRPSDEHLELFQVVQYRGEAGLPIDVTKKVVSIQGQAERVGVRQEVFAEEQVTVVSSIKQITHQQVETFIRNQEHSISEEGTPRATFTAKIEPLPKLQPTKAVAKEFVAKNLPLSQKPTERTTPEIVSEKIQQVADGADVEYVNLIESVKNTEILPRAESPDANPVDTLYTSVDPELEVDVKVESYFASETLDTFEVLAELAEAEKVSVQPDILITKPILQEEDRQDSNVSFALWPQPEEVLSLGSTLEKAAKDQPLEQTFVQLAQYFSNTLHEAQSVAESANRSLPESERLRTEIQTILQDIAEILPASYGFNEETGERYIQITPELTQELLVLLGASGYDHPKKVLIEFVQVHGLAYLLQTVHRMCSLNSVDNQQEFLMSPIQSVVQDDYVTNARLAIGKLLGGLIYKLYPRLAGDDV